MAQNARMKAVAHRQGLRGNDASRLEDVELPVPTPGPRDVLVKVEAISVNPVDTKVRIASEADLTAFNFPKADLKVLGWDVAGIVRATGTDVSLFEVGDEVYYCGAIDRPGANAEFHVVDERLIGHKPKTFTFQAAAALPLTALTAWEALFERMGLRFGKPAERRTLLITAAAGGVGSIAVQLARTLTSVTIIGTASRPETVSWAKQMGAHHVVDHRRSLTEQVRRIAPEGVDYVLSTSSTDEHFSAFPELLVPFGKLVVLDEPVNINLLQLKTKSLSFHWQMVFTRSLLKTTDQSVHQEILEEVSRLADMGLLRTTLTQDLGTINAENLRRAHEIIESGRSVGKVVLSGF